MIELKTAHKKFIDHLEETGKAGSTLIAYGKDITSVAKSTFSDCAKATILEDTAIDNNKARNKMFGDQQNAENKFLQE